MYQRAAVTWVAVHILPHEAGLRGWLRRAGVQPSDVDDIVQQTFCKLSEMDTVSHVADPKAYFFATARSVLLQRLRHERVVPIVAASDVIDQQAIDNSPSPEQTTGARRELRRVVQTIAALPKQYRDVVELRRLEGLSQKETAQRLGISEKVVENNLARGLKAVLRVIREGAADELEEETHFDETRHVAQH